jgi:transcriptional regulator with XRE-family HTH domain
MTHFKMTGRDLRAHRERLGLTTSQLATACGMSAAGGIEIDAIERMECKQVSGPLAIAVLALSEGWRPPHLRAGGRLLIAA